MKRLPTNALRVRVHVVVEEAIEAGVARGWSQAHKHTDNPSEDEIKEHLRRELANAFDERFTFPEGE